MAYEYLKLQSRGMLDDILQNDIYREWIEKENIDVQDINIETLYNMSKNEFLLFVDNFIRPLLCVYGVGILCNKEKDFKEELCGAIIKGHSVLIVDNYSGIICSSILQFRIGEDIDEYDYIVIDICNNGLYSVDIDLLLDPLSFFENQKGKDYADCILQIIHNNITYWNQMFWVVGCVCDIYLVQDLVFQVRAVFLEVFISR